MDPAKAAQDLFGPCRSFVTLDSQIATGLVEIMNLEFKRHNSVGQRDARKEHSPDVDRTDRLRWESGSSVFCRDFALLSTGHVTDVAEDLLLSNGTTLHAGDRATVTTICKEHVEIKFGDNTVDVSRGGWHRLRAPSRATFGDVDGGEASRGQMPS